MMALEAQVDTVSLSAFRDEAEVGWYGAATTVTFSLAMFSQAYRMSVYPLMARYALQSPAKLSRLYKRSTRYLGMLILPMVAGIILLSPQIVSLVFGPKFQPTTKVLQILIPSSVLAFLNVPNSRMMLIYNRQVWSSLFLMCSVTTNVLLNLVLAPSWGASGAAVARLCSSALYFLLNYLYVARFLAWSNLLWLLSRPVLATLIMAVVVWSVRAWSLPASIGVGMVTYAGALWLVGGILPDDIALVRQAISDWCNRTAPDRK
jgi:O-antigen/teichoic acid export membrane protein